MFDARVVTVSVLLPSESTSDFVVLVVESLPKVGCSRVMDCIYHSQLFSTDNFPVKSEQVQV